MIELVGRPLHQWDTGRKVRIVPLDDVRIDEVHFANKGDTKALVVNTVVDDSGTTANIPGKLLQTGRDLVVYAVFEEHTEYSKHFSVTGRPKPDDYVYDEEDYYPLKAILDEKVESEEYLERVADKAAAKVLPVVEEATDKANAATERATQAAASANKAANTANAAAKNVADSIEIIREIVDDGEDGPPIVCEASGEEITVSDASNRLLRGLTIFGKTTQNGTPSPSAPVALESAGDSGSIAVSITGKNLINPVAYMTDAAHTTLDGDVFTSNFQNGALYINVSQNNGTALPKGTYTATFLPITQGATCAFFVYSAATKEELLAKYGVTAGNASFTFAAEEDFYFAVGGAKPYGYQSYRLQLEAGNTGTAYEPHKQAQTLTVSTPNGLPGIPVTSGGNYTDSNGQTWICDEIDLAGGVYIKRVEQTVLNGMENWQDSFDSTGAPCFAVWLPNVKVGNHLSVCSHFQNVNYAFGVEYADRRDIYSDHESLPAKFFRPPNGVTTLEGLKAWFAANPTSLYYAAETPTETPLDADVLAAYAALHSNKPNTTVLNDAGAGQKLGYVADTKLYIDNKFTEMTNAIIASGANI